ncbi:MAG: hypothetical protein LRZ85_03920 [Alphaproteobacteria bacterium]|nr:hypothetical protein [Alphaproteobacteria bacterium]
MKKIHGRFLMISFFLAFLALPVSTAWAHICDKCPGDCGAAVAVLKSHHEKGEKDIIKDQPSVNMVQRMTDHKFWTVRNLFLEHFLPKLMAMSTQMTTTAMDQIRLVGLLFDAKHLLETDRVMQELQVQANKDYHPSESFCWFGTNVRSLTESETRGRFNQAALSEMQMTRQLGTFGSASAASGRDLYSRWQQFTAKYCDPKDNNWYQAGSGLETACGGGGSAKRRNIDIDYTRLVEVPRTLPVDFKDDAAV